MLTTLFVAPIAEKVLSSTSSKEENSPDKERESVGAPPWQMHGTTSDYAQDTIILDGCDHHHHYTNTDNHMFVLVGNSLK